MALFRVDSNAHSVDQSAYGRIVSEIGCKFVPELTADDVCEICVHETYSGVYESYSYFV